MSPDCSDKVSMSPISLVLLFFILSNLFSVRGGMGVAVSDLGDIRKGDTWPSPSYCVGPGLGQGTATVAQDFNKKYRTKNERKC